MRPDSSLAKSTSAMLQRWAVTLAAYNYTIQYRPGKQFPHADFLSRHAHLDPPETDEALSLVTNPLPIGRARLIDETRLVYGPVLAGLRNGWSNSARRKLLYSKRMDMALLPDGVITVHDRPLIPPACRNDVLHHLHMGHLGRDKMKSLARLLCWWPSIGCRRAEGCCGSCPACTGRGTCRRRLAVSTSRTARRSHAGKSMPAAVSPPSHPPTVGALQPRAMHNARSWLWRTTCDAMRFENVFVFFSAALSTYTSRCTCLKGC